MMRAMRSVSVFSGPFLPLCVLVYGCAGAPAPEPATAESPESESAAPPTTSERPPDDLEARPESSPGAEPAAPASTPRPGTEAEPGAVAADPGGRLALIPCDPDNRPEVCTREYRPVCGRIDTGVRCIQAPCPSTEEREFGNACTACASEGTVGYFPIRCAELKLRDAP